MAAATTKKPNEQEIVAHFQKLREDQRLIASKAAELQVDQKSHELVLETLKDVDKNRKCFRMIGGVLVERTVNKVVPALEQNKEQITKIIENLQAQMIAKGKEINDYREKYNIRFQGEAEEEKKTSNEGSSKSSGGVLVDKTS